MTSFLRAHKLQIMYIICGGFLLSIAFQFGAPFLNHGALATDAIIEVNGDKIPLRLYESHYSRAVNQLKEAPDKTQEQQLRQETVRDLVQMQVFSNESQRYGIVVPDAQVAASISNIPAFQTKGQFDPRQYGQVLTYQLKSTPQDFEEEQRGSVAFFKLRWLFQSVMKITDREVDLAYAQQLKDPTYKGQPKADPKKTWRPGSAEDRAAFRQYWSQEKMMWTFNQWYSQVAQQLRVKTHFELLDGSR